MAGVFRFTFYLLIIAVITARNVQGGNTQACLREGGVCGKIQYCDEEDRIPAYCGRGQVCCQKLPVGPDASCKDIGGECTDQDCGKMEQNKPCPVGLRCCIWV